MSIIHCTLEIEKGISTSVSERFLLENRTSKPLQYGMEFSCPAVSRWKAGGFALFALLFWAHALTDKDGFLLLDYVNLPFHEFGHIFFGFFGCTLGIWGGTLSQLLIPLIILIAFIVKEDTLGAAFALFWIGENFLNIAVYLGDARSMLLPLVGGGEHDWNRILSMLGLLEYDHAIANVLKVFGWVLMITSVIALTAISLIVRNDEDLDFSS